MSKIVLIYFVAFLISQGCTVSKDLTLASVEEEFHLYLLVGQSNMAGRGVVDSLSKITNENIVSLDKSNEWVLATDPLHFDKKEAGVGPGISFAQNILTSGSKKKVKIGLIPCAVGGSSINVWEPGAFDKATGTYPYDDALKRLKIAMSSGEIKGILWHQGETDVSPDRRRDYTQKLKVLITRLREEAEKPHLPVVVGELGYFTESKIRFNEMLKELPKHIDNIGVASSEGLTAKADNLHFDTPSSRELGKRYAEVMKELSND